jgi:radical SAM superfamily enzyme YgiQ (UPF0313 family)
MYDFENNAIRQLAAALRHRGRRVVEVYFKDWRNNNLEPPSHLELTRLVMVLRDAGVGLVGVSLRASAYQGVAQQVCGHLRAYLGVPLVLGGWHVTVRPEQCVGFADALCIGEGDHAFPDFIERFFAGGGALAAVRDTPGFWVHDADGQIVRNPPPPLVEDLDAIPWRDYTSRDKWVIHQGDLIQGEPMAKDPLYQVMCSIGCIQKCSFCHNSFDTGAEGARLRFRSVSSVLDELQARRLANPAIRRVRFDDEIFGLDRRWLREFAERYPREVGLPFDLLTEPTVVSEEYADLLKAAGAETVHMGLQSTESVNRDQLNRRASREGTRAAVERLTRRGMRIRYLVMVDIPNVTETQKAELFQFLQSVPRPYDLYLFSLTYFPGTLMVEEQISSGQLHPHEIEGIATKTFYQYRADLSWPRPASDAFWLALMVMESSAIIPRSVLAHIAQNGYCKGDPQPLIRAANAATLVKTAVTAGRMLRNGELTATLVRRWWNPWRMITM